MPLTDSDRIFLRWVEEHQDRRHLERDAREQMNYTLTGFYLRLHQLVDDPDTVVEFPQLVHRVLRERARRAELRQQRRIA